MAPTPAITSRIQALLDIVKMNKSIHTIHLDDLYSQHKRFRVSVIPYLETNGLRPRVRAIQKTRPTTYRAKLLGRALLSARTDANRYWMLLSGNAEVAFPSNSTMIVVAANLPTPTSTAAATSTANISAVAVSVMSDLMASVTGSLPTATAAAATSAATPSTASASDPAAVATNANAKAATPSDGQKRKASS